MRAITSNTGEEPSLVIAEEPDGKATLAATPQLTSMAAGGVRSGQSDEGHAHCTAECSIGCMSYPDDRWTRWFAALLCPHASSCSHGTADKGRHRTTRERTWRKKESNQQSWLAYGSSARDRVGPYR
jgi:hypothetical protein